LAKEDYELECWRYWKEVMHDVHRKGKQLYVPLMGVGVPLELFGMILL
jgi:hypothetical protein